MHGLSCDAAAADDGGTRTVPASHAILAERFSLDLRTPIPKARVGHTGVLHRIAVVIDVGSAVFVEYILVYLQPPSQYSVVEAESDGDPDVSVALTAIHLPGGILMMGESPIHVRSLRRHRAG